MWMLWLVYICSKASAFCSMPSNWHRRVHSDCNLRVYSDWTHSVMWWRSGLCTSHCHNGYLRELLDCITSYFEETQVLARAGISRTRPAMRTARGEESWRARARCTCIYNKVKSYWGPTNDWTVTIYGVVVCNTTVN